MNVSTMGIQNNIKRVIDKGGISPSTSPRLRSRKHSNYNFESVTVIIIV